MDLYAVPPRLPGPGDFLAAFERTLVLAETHQFRGVLLFEGHDVPYSPWVLAQHIVSRPGSLLPLLAVSPAYVRAEDAARLIGNLHRLYGRPLAVNLVAGAEARASSHADRYEDLQRFAAQLEVGLAAQVGAASGGDAVAAWFVAGHSDDAVALADRLGAANLRMLPEHLGAEVPAGSALNFGVVARPTTEAAWDEARALFPEQPGAARVASRMASRTDSTWKAELLTDSTGAPGYWRRPAQTLKADSPFYVGSYDEVAQLFADCRTALVAALLLDLPPDPADYRHLSEAVERSLRSEGTSSR